MTKIIHFTPAQPGYYLLSVFDRDEKGLTTSLLAVPIVAWRHEQTPDEYVKTGAPITALPEPVSVEGSYDDEGTIGVLTPDRLVIRLGDYIWPSLDRYMMDEIGKIVPVWGLPE